MTTAATLISDALIELGVIGANESPTPEDAAFGLRKLNQLMQRLSTSRQAFPVLTEISVTLTGAQSYTIGPSGTSSTARPVSINSATAADANGVEYAVSVITRAEWDSIAVKDVTGGPPEYVWYQAENTNGLVHVYPKANGYTLKLDCQVLLATFATVSGVLYLPEGYETWLTLSLADDMAQAYGRDVSADTRRRLAAAAAGVKRVNAEPLYLSVEDRSEFNIERGY